MNSSPRQNIALFIVVFLGFSFQVVSRSLESLDKKPVNVSTDFIDLIKILGSSVYNYRGRRKLDNEFPDSDSSIYAMYRDYGTSKKDERRKSSPMLMTQKDTLRDVLMMKLVSYYEDKYKLSRTSPAPTVEPGPERRNFRVGAKTNVDPIPTKNRVFYNTRPTYTQEPYIENNEEVVII